LQQNLQQQVLFYYAKKKCIEKKAQENKCIQKLLTKLSTKLTALPKIMSAKFSLHYQNKYIIICLIVATAQQLLLC